MSYAIITNMTSVKQGFYVIVTHTRLTALCPGYPGEPVPERQHLSGFY